MNKPSTRVQRFISRSEFAERASVSERTVSRWIEAGDLHAHRLGGQVRISEEDAAAFFAARRR